MYFRLRNYFQKYFYISTTNLEYKKMFQKEKENNVLGMMEVKHSWYEKEIGEMECKLGFTLILT